MIPDIVQTEDGSITCRDVLTGELYHNRAGAYSEALKNYVEPCSLSRRILDNSSIQILDVCFGLGYNSLVFIDQLVKLLPNFALQGHDLKLSILGLDLDPNILQLVPKVLADPKFDHLVYQLKAAGSEYEKIIENFSHFGHFKFDLHLNNRSLQINVDLRQRDIRKEIPNLAISGQHSFDYIFHDGFSPKVMPELWTIDLFEEYAKLIRPQGRIITYCAATAVRGALRECGLIVKRTTPLGGKSGGTVAARSGFARDDVAVIDLSITENERLESRSSIPYRDSGFSSTRKEILHRRVMEQASSLLPAFADN